MATLPLQLKGAAFAWPQLPFLVMCMEGKPIDVIWQALGCCGTGVNSSQWRDIPHQRFLLTQRVRRNYFKTGHLRGHVWGWIWQPICP